LFPSKESPSRTICWITPEPSTLQRPSFENASTKPILLASLAANTKPPSSGSTNPLSEETVPVPPLTGIESPRRTIGSNVPVKSDQIPLPFATVTTTPSRIKVPPKPTRPLLFNTGSFNDLNLPWAMALKGATSWVRATSLQSVPLRTQIPVEWLLAPCPLRAEANATAVPSLIAGVPNEANVAEVPLIPGAGSPLTAIAAISESKVVKDILLQLVFPSLFTTTMRP